MATRAKSAKFETEHKVFAYLFAGGVTAMSLPLITYHATLAIGLLACVVFLGLALSDIVLWFAAHWSVKVKNIAMRVVCLIVKFSLGGVMLFNSGIVLFILKGDYITERLINQQTEARLAEIGKRTEAAKELAGTKGGRLASREAMKMEGPKSAEEIAQGNRDKLEKHVPGWYLDVGIFVSPALAALIGFIVMAITAMVIKRREEAEEQSDRRIEIGVGDLIGQIYNGHGRQVQGFTPAQASAPRAPDSSLSGHTGQQTEKPRFVWQDSRIVNRSEQQDQANAQTDSAEE
jgi:hypothetical protein